MATASNLYSQVKKDAYEVPSCTGGYLPANPVKFCLKFKPPTIAIVYQFPKKSKKYVHEIRVDIKEHSDISKLCDELCQSESVYLNPKKINKTQIKELLAKLQTSLFKKANKENNLEKYEESRQQEDSKKSNFLSKKRFNPLSEEQEKILQENDAKKEQEKQKVQNLKADILEDFDDDFDDPWDLSKPQNKPADKKPEIKELKQEQPKSNPFEQKLKPAFDDLEEIGFELDSERDKPKKDEKKLDLLPNLQQKKNDAKKNEVDNGLFVDDNFGDDFDDDFEDDFEKSHGKEDNNIFEDSRTKENKVKKDDEPIKEATNLASKKEEIQMVAQGKLDPDDDDDDDGGEDGDFKDLDPEDKIKLMLDQFNYFYQNDPSLKQLLGSDIQNLSVEDKIEILRAYMDGGGTKGLTEGEDVEAMMDPEEQKMITDAFNEIYTTDEKLRGLLGDNVYSLGLNEKRQIILEYKEKGGLEGLMEEEQEPSFIMHNGKRYDRVQIEEDDQEYLMDEEGNLYNNNFEYIGQANPSDEDG